jgi:ATP synthase protein I
MTPPRNGDEFAKEIERQAARRRAGRGRSVWQGLAQVGTVGWTVALPAVAGAFLGRWVDGRYGTGIFWTLSLLTLGLAVGCVAAWRAMSRELRE